MKIFVEKVFSNSNHVKKGSKCKEGFSFTKIITPMISEKFFLAHCTRTLVFKHSGILTLSFFIHKSDALIKQKPGKCKITQKSITSGAVNVENFMCKAVTLHSF